MAVSGITVAWAVRIDETQLGARMEAHDRNHQRIKILYECHSAKAKSPLSRAPNEILALMAESLYDIVYQERIMVWRAWRKCSDNECKDNDHLTDEESTQYTDLQHKIGNLEEVACCMKDSIQQEMLYAKLFGLESKAKKQHHLGLHAYAEYLEDIASGSKVLSWYPVRIQLR